MGATFSSLYDALYFWRRSAPVRILMLGLDRCVCHREGPLLLTDAQCGQDYNPVPAAARRGHLDHPKYVVRRVACADAAQRSVLMSRRSSTRISSCRSGISVASRVFGTYSRGGAWLTPSPYWRCYYADTAAIIYVVDATDHERLPTARAELLAMLAEEELRGCKLLVFANKQDLPNAMDEGQIGAAIGLNELRDRQWSIWPCSAKEGTGLSEGLDWCVVGCWTCGADTRFQAGRRDPRQVDTHATVSRLTIACIPS